jgi:predicted oxidoreductase
LPHHGTTLTLPVPRFKGTTEFPQEIAMTDNRLLPFPPKTRAFGKTGKTISSLAWGMWRFKGEDVKAARALVDAVFESGISFFDTADIYGADTQQGFGSAEALLGKVFAEEPRLRDRMVLATKGGIIIGVPYDSSAVYLEQAIDISLKRLNTEHVDLWQIHRPDILTHPAEIAAALEKAHKAGKIGAVGVSNFTIAQTDALQKFLSMPIVSTQPEFSPLHLVPIENGLLDHSMMHERLVMAWSPLGGGRLADPTSARELAVAAALDAVATKFSVSRTAAAYSWMMAHPAGVVPIVGSQQAARIHEAADAYKINWTRTDWYNVLVAARGERLP